MHSQSIHLNHAGTSWPKPACVVDAANAVLSSNPASWPELFATSHQTVADFFHVEPSRLLLTPSCTAAISIAVADLDWKSGERIVTSTFEHHALYRSCLKLIDRGVEVTTLPATVSEDGTTELIDLEVLASELEKGGARLLALTAACNVTGQRIPLSQAIEIAHQHDVLVLVDGAQIAGWWDLDLVELDADLFAFAGHKGPQAPWGIGGLYVAPDVGMDCPYAACDRECSDPSRVRSTSMPGYCDVGSVNYSALAGLAAAAKWLNEPVQEHRLRDARALAQRFADAIREMPGVSIHGDGPIANKMPIVAFTVGGRSPDDVASSFAKQKLLVSGGLQCAPQAHLSLDTAPAGVVRVSFGPANQVSEVDRAVRLIQELVESP